MATVLITKHADMAEEQVAESPEMSKADAEALAEHVAAHICPHHERDEDGTRTTLKSEAQGEPGVEVDCGFVRLLSDTIHSVEVKA